MGSREFRAGWLLSLSMPALAGIAPLCMAQEASVPQAILVQPENVRVDYGQVLRAEPIYETQTEVWLEQQCEDGKRKFLSRVVGAVKDVLSPGRSAQASGEAAQDECRMVPVEREFRRPIAYDVDYVHRGSKYRSRLPSDPGNRLRVRVSVTPVAPAGNQD